MNALTAVVAFIALAVASGSLAQTMRGSVAPDATERTEAELGADHARRLVWVLLDSPMMTEAGPVEGAPDVVLYQVECADRQLRSFRRTYDEFHPAFGAASTLVIRLKQNPLSSEGARALTGAFASLC
jgi:hypothetical protein